MEKKIVRFEESVNLTKQLHNNGKKIVVAGGCFDILHVGHISFLENAKKAGDILIVFLESDKHIEQMKGIGRPINTQIDRARLLAALSIVDYIILLPDNVSDQLYDSLILDTKPAIIATTQPDVNRRHKERQAKMVGGTVVDVIPKIENQSTSRIASLLEKEI